jgi:uncharacterized protein
MYKLSKYTLICEANQGKNDFLAYNTLSQALVLLDHNLKKALENLKENNSLDKSISKDYLESLLKNRIIVLETEDENKTADQWLWQIRNQQQKIKATILTTYKCNLACTYCFEDKVKNKITLDDTQAQKVARWLIERASLHKIKEIEVTFYGGEPLLNIKGIEIISKILQKWAQDINGKYEFYMVSNGTLLTPLVVNQLQPLGFKGAKLTLDGTADAHDKLRPFVGGKGSFDIILKNIEACADKVEIFIGVNLTPESVESAHKLLDLLVQKGLHTKLNKMEFAPVTARLGEGCSVELNETLEYLEQGLFEQLLTLRKKMMGQGFNSIFSMAANRCSLCEAQGNEMTIDPSGQIYKCNVLVGHPEYIVGHIDSQDFNGFHQEMVAFSPWQIEKCQSCAFLPACNGACRYKALIEKGSLTAENCLHNYFTQQFPEWIKLEYKKMTQPSA